MLDIRTLISKIEKIYLLCKADILQLNYQATVLSLPKFKHAFMGTLLSYFSCLSRPGTRSFVSCQSLARKKIAVALLTSI